MQNFSWLINNYYASEKDNIMKIYDLDFKNAVIWQMIDSIHFHEPF